ncbi:hypothetical protein EV426DRAFT_1637 [Tirmania nivea]|nr:hypothetical protein EV426DRAFT_1637 [Tirmania nivea]
MKQRATAFVSATYLYCPDSAKLGRIVLNPQEPLETYYDLFPSQEVVLKEIHITPSIDLACTYNESKKKSLGGALLQLFYGALSSSAEGGTSLEGETKRYQLGNAEQLFRKACAAEDVREWLQENVIKPKVDAYMIVGYHTITNPRIVNGNRLERKTNFRADDAIGSAAPGLPGVANVRNFTWGDHRYKLQLSASGEGIWAVQYRKVVYKLESWFSECQIKLKDSKWKMFLHIRGQEDAGKYVVDADLGDVAEFEPEPADSDDEDEVATEAPESYFGEVGVIGEAGETVEEEFIFFHEMPDLPEEL